MTKKKTDGLLGAVPKPNLEKFGLDLLRHIGDFGLGTLSKADFEAYIFHLIKTYINDEKVAKSYDWMKVLKITPTKLRSLQLIESAKYLNLDLKDNFNWKLLCNAMSKKKIEIEDRKKGTIRFFIDDTHTQRFIEKFVEEKGSGLDYTLNRKQVVLKYEMYQLLMNELIKKFKLSQKSLVSALNKDKSEKGIEQEFVSLKSYLEDLKTKFAGKSVDEATVATFEFVANSAIRFVKNKVVGK